MDSQYIEDIGKAANEAIKVFEKLDSAEARSAALQISNNIAAILAQCSFNIAARFGSEATLQIQETALEACLFQARAGLEALKRQNARKEIS